MVYKLVSLGKCELKIKWDSNFKINATMRIHVLLHEIINMIYLFVKNRLVLNNMIDFRVIHLKLEC